MHEVGGHHSHEAHGDSKLVVPVSVTLSILAVLVAAATLMGHRAHTEELLLQAQASDQWNYFQAKNIRLNATKVVVDSLDVLQARDSEKAELTREKYQKEVERYEGEKDAISDKAKDLEKERDLYRKRADHFDTAEVILEIGLIMCSLTLLANKKIFWFSGIAIAGIGVVVAAIAFLTRV
jgi:YesN/AraC family two-component response regulator